LAKGRQPAVLVSEDSITAATRADDQSAADWEIAETMTLRGRSQPITSYRPVGARVGQ
jgi:hypothetical protein